MDNDEIYENRWVRIGDDDRGLVGKVDSVDDPHDPYRVTVNGVDGHQYVVPAGLIFPVEHPIVDKAAKEILFTLEAFDPSWKNTDTIDIRRKIVRQVLQVVKVKIDDLPYER